MTKTKKLTNKQELWAWRIGGIVITFAPIVTAIIANRNEYFATREAGIAIGLGGGLALVLVLFSLLGKIGKLFDSGFKVAAIVFVFALLLEPIILNIKFLAGMLLLGELLNAMIVIPNIKRLEKLIERHETVKVVKEAMRG